MEIYSQFGFMRRRVTMYIAAATVSLRLGYATANEAAGLAFEIHVPTQLLTELQKDAHYSKLLVKGDPESVDPTKGLPLIYIAAGVLAIPELARSLLALYRDFKYGGTIIEVRKGTLVITQDGRLDADTIVVKDSSGKITIHRNRSAASFDEWAKMLVAAKK
jgi:hypothetical protein